jgi:APA family basic amino acid/polyamine antiporter
VVFCAGMAASLPAATWLRLVLWSAIGIAFYFIYGYRHSRLRKPEVGTP